MKNLFKRIEIPHKIKIRNNGTSPNAGHGFMNKEMVQKSKEY